MDLMELREELRIADDRVLELSSHQEVTDLLPETEALREEVQRLKRAHERTSLLEDEVELLRADIDSYREREAKAILEKTQAEDELMHAEGELEETKKSEKLARRQSSAIDTEAIALKSEIEGLTTKLKTTQDSLEYASMELGEVRERYQQSERKADEVSAALKEKSMELEERTTELQEMAEAKAQADEMCAQLTTLTAQYQKLKIRLDQEEGTRHAQKDVVSSHLAVEKTRYEALAARYKDQGAILTDYKEITDRTKSENDKLKAKLAASQQITNQMVQQADHGLRAVKQQKILKEQVKLLTEKIVFLEDDRTKLKREFMKKQKVKITSQQEHERVLELKKLREENTALKVLAKQSSPPALKKELEEMKVANEVLKEMVRSANINTRVAITKHRKGARSPSESTLLNPTVAVMHNRKSPSPAVLPTPSTSPNKASIPLVGALDPLDLHKKDSESITNAPHEVMQKDDILNTASFEHRKDSVIEGTNKPLVEEAEAADDVGDKVQTVHAEVCDTEQELPIGNSSHEDQPDGNHVAGSVLDSYEDMNSDDSHPTAKRPTKPSGSKSPDTSRGSLSRGSSNPSQL